MEKIKQFLFQNKNTRQTILKNVIWLSGGVTIGKIARSLMIIYAARILGTEGYGVFSYAISFAAVFNIFSDIGLSSLLTRELVKREEKEEYLATSLILKIVLVGLTTIFIAFVSPFFTNINEAKPLMFMMALLMAFDSMRSFFFSISRAQNRMQSEAFFEIINEFFITSIGFIILFNFPSIRNFTLGYLSASGLGLIIVLFSMRRHIAKTFVYFQKDLILTILKSAWPFAVMGIFGVLMTNIDSVIVGLFKTTKDLGLFSAAQKPISLMYLIPGFLYTTLFPFISKFIKDDEENKLSLLLRKSMTVSLGLALPMVLGGVILASPIINVVYGYEYIGAVLTFQILLLTLIPIFPGMILSSVLLAEDKQKIFIKSSIVGAMINIILDFILIPKYGIAGSAISTVFAQIAVNLVFFIEIKKNHTINIWQDMRKMLFAVLVMSLVVFIMKILFLPLIIIITVAIIIYLGILYLLKEEIIQDIKEGFSI